MDANLSYFIDTPANILGNNKLRTPQIAAYININEYFASNPSGEALVVLPTGTGKSGLISIAPFGVSKGRVLIITPGLVTKQSIRKTQELLSDNFWINFDVLFSIDDIPVINEYESSISDQHLKESNIIYSNIHKLTSNREGGLVNRVPNDFFDMIIVDESHHAAANSWDEVLSYFNNAKKLHVTGTPFRGDNRDIPGEKIHETHLSEVMRDKYVKWLRKETVNEHTMFFTIKDMPGKYLTKEEVIELKDREWLERSVALSKECSLDVINHSIQRLQELRVSSPNVPHKILAVGCSILHAEDIASWYQDAGLRTVIVHSEMEQADIELSFKQIDTHQCDVVVSVNMLMEGYDHKYLSILAIFRPYRSINAFAQVVGRVLRAIPDEEITDFTIDNNAVVIYHEETGLDIMWASFQNEVDRAKHQRVKEYPKEVLDSEYRERDSSLAGISVDESFVSSQSSYLADLDFNKLFEEKRKQIRETVERKINDVKLSGALSTFDDDDLEILKETLLRKETKNVADNEIDPDLVAKRPHQARKEMRAILTKKAQDEATNLLADIGLDEKGVDIAPRFARNVYQIKPTMTNDAALVIYINSKLYSRFGKVGDRDNETLKQSIDDIDVIVNELRRMLK